MSSPWEAGNQAQQEHYDEMFAVGDKIINLLKEGAQNRDKEDSILFTTGVLGCVLLALNPEIRLFLLEEIIKFIKANTKSKKRK
jgi:hypothetical protein